MSMLCAMTISFVGVRTRPDFGSQKYFHAQIEVVDVSILYVSMGHSCKSVYKWPDESMKAMMYMKAVIAH